MKKISKQELLTILAAIGVSGSSCAYAANLDSSNDGLGKTEHPGTIKLGDDAKCGKGSCGTDEKGAAAAQDKHKKKEAKKAEKKAEKKEEEKKDDSKKDKAPD